MLTDGWLPATVVYGMPIGAAVPEAAPEIRLAGRCLRRCCSPRPPTSRGLARCRSACSRRCRLGISGTRRWTASRPRSRCSAHPRTHSGVLSRSGQAPPLLAPCCIAARTPIVGPSGLLSFRARYPCLPSLLTITIWQAVGASAERAIHKTDTSGRMCPDVMVETLTDCCQSEAPARRRAPATSANTRRANGRAASIPTGGGIGMLGVAWTVNAGDTDQITARLSAAAAMFTENLRSIRCPPWVRCFEHGVSRRRGLSSE